MILIHKRKRVGGQDLTYFDDYYSAIARVSSLSLFFNDYFLCISNLIELIVFKCRKKINQFKLKPFFPAIKNYYDDGEKWNDDDSFYIH